MELQQLHLIGQGLLVLATLCLIMPRLKRAASGFWSKPRQCWSKPPTATQDQRVRRAFQVEICHWVVHCLPVMLLMLAVRAICVALRPFNRIIAQNTIPALDLPCFCLHMTCLLLYAFPKLVRPASLEFWYVLIQSFVFIPYFFLDVDHAAVTNRTLPARVFTSVLSKRHLTTVAFNILHAIAASTRRPATASLDHVPKNQTMFSVQPDAFQEELTESMLIIMIALGVRWLIYKNCRISLQLQDSSIELSAVSRLLHGFCDAVVEMDQNLSLNQSGMQQLSTLLLHGAPAGCSDFLTYFSAGDQVRVRDLLTRPGRELPPVALNAQLLDSSGSGVNVELLHVMRQGTDGEENHLVGLREFQDVAQVAPLSTEIRDLKELSLMFSALDLKLLHAEESLLDLCRQHLDFEHVSDLSLFDLSSGDGRGQSSLSGQVQEAINRYVYHSESGHQTITLKDIRVFDRTVTTLTLDQDYTLGLLVGTLIFQRDNLLTPQRLADCDQERLRRVSSTGRRGSSRSSRSGRLRRSWSGGSSPSSGRVSELRSQSLALSL